MTTFTAMAKNKSCCYWSTNNSGTTTVKKEPDIVFSEYVNVDDSVKSSLGDQEIVFYGNWSPRYYPGCFYEIARDRRTCARFFYLVEVNWVGDLVNLPKADCKSSQCFTCGSIYYWDSEFDKRFWNFVIISSVEKEYILLSQEKLDNEKSLLSWSSYVGLKNHWNSFWC